MEDRHGSLWRQRVERLQLLTGNGQRLAQAARFEDELKVDNLRAGDTF